MANLVRQIKRHVFPVLCLPALGVHEILQEQVFGRGLLLSYEDIAFRLAGVDLEVISMMPIKMAQPTVRKICCMILAPAGHALGGVGYNRAMIDADMHTDSDIIMLTGSGNLNVDECAGLATNDNGVLGEMAA